MKIIQSIFLLMLFVRINAQIVTASSNSDLSLAKEDSTKCKILDKMIEDEDNPEVWIKYNRTMESLAGQKLKSTDGKLRIVYLKYLASAINNKAFYYQNLGNIDSALSLFRKSLEIRYDIKNKEGIANSLNNIGHIYYSLADFETAMGYYKKCIKVQEEIGDKTGLGTSYNNLGAVYERLGDAQKAIDLFQKSLETRKAAGDKRGQAFCYNNLAKIYFERQDYKTALEYQMKGLKIREETNAVNDIGVSYNNIGSVYLAMNDLEKAKDYFTKGLQVHLEVKDKQSSAVSYNNLGVLYSKLKNPGAATEYFNKALKISMELGFPEDIFKPAKGLYEIHKSRGNYKAALEMYELYKTMKDSSEKKQTILAYKKYTVAEDTVSGSNYPSETLLKSQDKTAELEKEVSRQSIWIYALASLLFVSAALIVYLFISKKG